MSEDYLIRNCAPTLAGIKTGSMFSCPCDSREDLWAFVRQINHRLSPKGLRLLPLRLRGKNALLYLYRPASLQRDLSHRAAIDLLQQCGYRFTRCDDCLEQLVKRLREPGEFPHEIGLFLGYPAEDVRGFMEQGPQHCKASGCWKVYRKEEAAMKTFAQYRKCTRIYRDLWAGGKAMEQLTVPTRTGLS